MSNYVFNGKDNLDDEATHPFAGITGTLVDQMQMTEGVPSDLDVAIAKARVGEAVGLSTDTAHQVMGAMGYTREHHLNYLTRRLWLWRDQFGHETFWQSEIGKHFLSANQADLWTQITDLS